MAENFDIVSKALADLEATTAPTAAHDHYQTALAALRLAVEKWNDDRSALERVIDGKDLTEPRLESLRFAAELGASEETLTLLRDATLLDQDITIVLPPNRLEHLSRGRGWARKGRGDDVEWGVRVDHGYEVGPGRWNVGGTDGFSRKRSTDWDVQHVQVGDQTWTIAD